MQGPRTRLNNSVFPARVNFFSDDLCSSIRLNVADYDSRLPSDFRHDARARARTILINLYQLPSAPPDGSMRGARVKIRGCSSPKRTRIGGPRKRAVAAFRKLHRRTRVRACTAAREKVVARNGESAPHPLTARKRAQSGSTSSAESRGITLWVVLLPPRV